MVAASAPLDIRVWRVDTQPASKLNGDATTTLTLVRELSIMSVGQPLRVGPLSLPRPYQLAVVATYLVSYSTRDHRECGQVHWYRKKTLVVAPHSLPACRTLH